MRSRASLGSHPIHPMLIPFPFALWTAGVVADLVGAWSNNSFLWAAGFYALLGGCIVAVFAAAAGIADYLTVVPPHSSGKKRATIHGALNSIVLLGFVYILFRRGGIASEPDSTVLLIEVVLAGALSYSGWLGGTLVYRNQIGVDHRYANAGKIRERSLETWDQPVCNVGEIGEGQMMLAKFGEERVVVGRCAQGFVAFSDHCTHKGGPLHDGALVGCTVQCPWHGSQFDIHTGRVVAGPANHKIGVFEIAIRDNEVYVIAPPERIKSRDEEERAA